MNFMCCAIIKLKCHIISILIFSLCYVSFGLQQTNTYKPLKFKQFSLINGLSQSSVLCILQDKKGFIWFGTRDGLNRYDGHTFVTYRHNTLDANSLSNSFIKSLFEDKNGNLWVGTINGLNKYLPQIDGFSRFKYANTKTFVNNKSNNEIWSIASNEKDFLWLGTNFGLEKFNIKKEQSTWFLAQNKSQNNISNNRIRSLLITKDNNLWICNTNSIDKYDISNQYFTNYLYPETFSSEINLNFTPVIYEDRNANLWLGYKDGLFLFNKKSNRFEPFIIDSTGITQITYEVRDIHQDYLGNLWIGTYNGLYILNSKKNIISHFIHNENETGSLSQNSVYSILEDTKGDIWIGTYAGGVNYFDRSFDVFKHFSTGTNNSKLSYKVVSSILEDADTNLWIGTEGGGVNFYNTNTGFFEYYKNNPNEANSISSNNVKSMLQTRSGNFWIGTHNGGLNFLNPKIKPFKFEKYLNIPDNPNSLSNNRVISLHEDCQNNIWIGTSGGGLNKMNVATKTISRVQDATGTISNLVYHISKTSSKDTLLISGDNGLVKFNIKTQKFVKIYYKGSQNIYDFNATLCVYEDASKNIWIATEGDGLYYYNTTTKQSVKYGIPQGLPNEVIYSILPENTQTLWFSTNHGLSRLNLKTKEFKNFDISNGLISDEFNFGAYIKLKNGNLMFGGTSGIDYFNPKAIQENSFIPPVSITNILVNNKPFLAENIEKNEITLKHNQNVFSFNFVALSYSQPIKNNYAYKLEGFDADWIYIGNKKTAAYTNLDAGSYLFKVKASNSDGLWNEEGASVVVEILPAPWKTWWAYLLYALAILGILFYVRKYSLIRIYEKNQLKQERLEKERLEEINQMKLRLFTNISHDFRTPLTLIIGPLERMLNQKSGNDFIQKQHEIMHRNASVLLQLINQLLDFRKSESGKLKLNASQSDVVSFIADIKLAFDDLANVRQINFIFIEPKTPIYLWFDKINLKKIVFNLLSNAFKFTPDGGTISIHLSTITKKHKLLKSTEYFKLEIIDSGRGIPENNLKAIFDRYYQFGTDEATRSGTGIGLALCKNLIKLHHGKIKAQSTEGLGTSFIVLLPLGNQHLKENEYTLDETKIENHIKFYSDKPNFIIKPTISNNTKTENQSINKFKPTLLIVEDNAEVRLFIKEIFTDDNSVFEAENGEIALEIAKNKDIDLVISDVMMPVMDGVTLCHQIKTNILTSHIPVILLTAKTSEESQRQGYLIGADAYITKPFDAEILKIRVVNLLGLRQNLITKFRKDIILEPKELTITSADELFLQKAINLVEDNLSNSNFSVTEFIDEMGMSRSVLYRKLKALTDQSLTEFIRTIKLKRAAQLIVKSQLSISEIAFDLGFNDLKHFRKSFQKLFNELPSEYRQKNNSSPDDSEE